MITDILKSSALKDSLNESQMAEIESAFNEAVDLKASQVANDIIAEKEISLKEEYEAKELELAEKFEEHTNNFEAKMLNKLDGFINERIEDFIAKSEELLEDEQKVAKAEALLKVFDNLIETAGVSVSKIVENGKIQANGDYDRVCEKYDAIVAERAELKSQLSALRKEQIIAEATSGMNLVDAEKFKNIASLLLEADDCEDEEDAEAVKDKVEKLKASQAKSKDSDDDDKDGDDGEDKKPTNEGYRGFARDGGSHDWSNF